MRKKITFCPFPEAKIKVNNLLTLLDYSADEIMELIDSSISLKQNYKKSGPTKDYFGRTIALYFEKPSLRTISTFQVGINQFGGDSIILDPGSIGMGKRESVADISRCLTRWVDAIVIRCFDQKLLEEIAKYSSVPIINALTDDYHPCQALAFAQSLKEHKGELKGKKVVFVGDGNNVANSIAILCAKLGMHFVLACPEGFEQPTVLLEKLEPLFKATGGSYECYNEPSEAVKNADILYGDVWVSMGQESQKESKTAVFEPFQINGDLLKLAGSECLVTHCLPAHRGEEITDEVMESSRNICFDEAENRLHAQKAVLHKLVPRF